MKMAQWLKDFTDSPFIRKTIIKQANYLEHLETALHRPQKMTLVEALDEIACRSGLNKMQKRALKRSYLMKEAVRLNPNSKEEKEDNEVKKRLREGEPLEALINELSAKVKLEEREEFKKKLLKKYDKMEKQIEQQRPTDQKFNDERITREDENPNVNLNKPGLNVSLTSWLNSRKNIIAFVKKNTK